MWFGCRHVWPCISTKQCVLQPAVFLEAQLGNISPKQATLCHSDYSKQICDTLSSRWFMKRVMTAELPFIQYVCAAHIWRKHWSGQLLVAGQRNLSLGCSWQMKKGQHGETPADESEKCTHMHATALGYSFDNQPRNENLFVAAKWRDRS